MKNLVKLYLPTKQDVLIEKYAKRMSEYFGGCTVVKGLEGYWKNDKNELVRDDITWLISYSSWYETSYLARSAAKDACIEFNQDCVSVEINDELLFVKQDGSYTS